MLDIAKTYTTLQQGLLVCAVGQTVSPRAPARGPLRPVDGAAQPRARPVVDVGERLRPAHRLQGGTARTQEKENRN